MYLRAECQSLDYHDQDCNSPTKEFFITEWKILEQKDNVLCGILLKVFLLNSIENVSFVSTHLHNRIEILEFERQ